MAKKYFLFLIGNTMIFAILQKKLCVILAGHPLGVLQSAKSKTGSGQFSYYLTTYIFGYFKISQE